MERQPFIPQEATTPQEQAAESDPLLVTIRPVLSQDLIFDQQAMGANAVWLAGKIAEHNKKEREEKERRKK